MSKPFNKFARGSSFEPMERRVLLSAAPFVATSSNLHDLQHGPLAKAGANLANLYLNYRSAQHSDAMQAFDLSTSAETNAAGGSPIDVAGGTVGVELIAIGSLSKFIQSMQSMGMSVQSITPGDNAIAGFVPITLLSQIAQRSDVLHLTPLDKPSAHQEGVAPDQADQAMQIAAARSTYGLTGRGVTVGVISDSVNQVGNGLADSIATGDLPSNVRVINDGEPGDTDEGRALLEEIYDLAPGANLVFDSAGQSQQSMADSVAALKSAGCNVIIDDIGFANEPFFQPGVIDQAINKAVAQGVTYVTAAGNSGTSGFEQAASFVSANDGNSDYLVNFDSGGTSATKMDITVTQSGQLTLEWDDPYDGVTGNVNADLNIMVYTMNGSLRYEGSDNTFATGVPLQQIQINPGNYQVEIETSNTPSADLPRFYEFTGDFTMTSTQYSGTRTSIIGHAGLSNAISVGAVPFADAPPFSTTTPIPTEDFSSAGPVIESRNAQGNLLPTALTIDKPDISGADGNNTSFFGNAGPHDPTSYPQFYGTSSAAGNVAGAVALIKQADANASQAQILTALEQTATPVNGQTAGTYNPTGGYGLVDAAAAVAKLNAIVNPPASPVATIVPVSPNPTSAAVSSISIDYSLPVTGFSLSDLSLSLNGGANLLTGAQSLTTSDNRNFSLVNLGPLTGTAGQYTLTLTAAGSGITGTDGAALLTSASTSFQVLAPAAVAPIVPAALEATAASSIAISLTFRDADRSVTGYVLERATHGSFNGKLVNISLPAGSDRYTDSDLSAATTYYYRVYSINQAGTSGFSRTVSATTFSPGEVVLSNTSSRYVTVTGSWAASTAVSGYYGSDYLQDDDTGKGTKSVKYRPYLPAAGEYYIYATWTRAPDRATNVPFDIFSKTGVLIKTVKVNERSTGGTGWVLLGEFKLHSETPSFVRIRNTGTHGEVIANAIEFLPAGDVKGKPASSVALARAAAAGIASGAVVPAQEGQSEIELLRDEIN